MFFFLKHLLGIKDQPRDYSDKIEVWEHQRRIEQQTIEVLDRGLQPSTRLPFTVSKGTDGRDSSSPASVPILSEGNND
jgi:hypothetical protein